MKVITGEEVAALEDAFPHIPEVEVRRLLKKHNYDIAATAEALLAFSSSTTPNSTSTTTPTTTSPTATTPSVSSNSPSSSPSKDDKNEWTCSRCTLRCPKDTLRCLACDAPNPSPPPLSTSTSTTTKESKEGVPAWWSTFWETYGSSCGYSQDQAKQILFQAGKIKQSSILTAEVKEQALKLLGLEEAHPIDTTTTTNGPTISFPYLPYPYPHHTPHPICTPHHPHYPHYPGGTRSSRPPPMG